MSRVLVLASLVIIGLGCSSQKITSVEMVAAMNENRESINTMSQVLVNVLNRLDAVEKRLGDEYVETKSSDFKP